jgi:hypothetical protein
MPTIELRMTMKFPEWWRAPEELFEIDGHCGLLAAWSVLHHFGKQVEVSQLIAECRYTKRHGVFTVCLAACLKEFGLEVSFHSDPDNQIGGFERRGYAHARRLGLLIEPAVDLPALLRERKRGRVPIVFFNTSSGVGHFSPLLALRGGVLHLPLAEGEGMPPSEFLTRWSSPGILRQCVIVGPNKSARAQSTGTP